MKRLSNKKIRNICDEMITILEQRSSTNPNFLCIELKRILMNKGYKDVFEIQPHNIIPKFTIENAVKYANGRKPQFSWFAWWEHLDNGDDKTYPIETFNFDDRIKFLEWIKSQYPVTPKQPLIQKWLQKLINIFK